MMYRVIYAWRWERDKLDAGPTWLFHWNTYTKNIESDLPSRVLWRFLQESAVTSPDDERVAEAAQTHVSKIGQMRSAKFAFPSRKIFKVVWWPFD